MTIGYNEIILNGLVLNLKSVTKTKVPATIKQKVGGNLVKHNIPANKDKQDIKITGNGMIFDTSTTATTTRRLLENSNDITPYHYYDGLVTASMIIEDLQFNDSGDNPLHYEYRISLIQYNQ